MFKIAEGKAIQVLEEFVGVKFLDYEELLDAFDILLCDMLEPGYFTFVEEERRRIFIVVGEETEEHDPEDEVAYVDFIFESFKDENGLFESCSVTWFDIAEKY